MEEKVLYELLITEGWITILIAMATIFIVGIFKFFKTFDRIPKDKRKPVYFAVNSAIAAVLGVSLTAALQHTGVAYAVNIFSAIIATNALYAVYENTGIRTMVRSFGHFIVCSIAKDKVKKEVMSIVNQIIKDDAPADNLGEPLIEDEVLRAENAASKAENEIIADEDETPVPLPEELYPDLFNDDEPTQEPEGEWLGR